MSDERYKVEAGYGDPREATVMENPRYKPPCSEMEKLLESAAREWVTNTWPLISNSDLETETRAAFQFLKRRLLPLLDAGQAMREFYDPAQDEEMPDHVIIAWDAAKQKAMEGK